MNFKKVLEEIYDTGIKQYPAYSTPARKDFAPLSTRDGYNYPYQQNQPTQNLTTPPPDAPISYPWPLQTVTDDLSDSFVYLMAAANKISQTVKNNPAIDKDQKIKLLELFKLSKKALEIIKNVGISIGEISNMAGPQPTQNPVIPPERIEPESLPDTGNMVRIKIK